MKLTVRIVDLGFNGPTLVLCDEAGTPLPKQTEVRLEQGVGDATRLHVSFIVDGDGIRLVG